MKRVNQIITVSIISLILVGCGGGGSDEAPVFEQEPNSDHLNAVYEEVELADMEWDEEEDAYTYPCPCGDKFIMPMEDLEVGEDIALCPSCSLRIRVLYDVKEFE